MRGSVGEVKCDRSTATYKADTLSLTADNQVFGFALPTLQLAVPLSLWIFSLVI